MTVKNKSEISSAETYSKLTWELGKKFVDESLLSILWFDETMDVAEYWNVDRNNTKNIPSEIANILSDTWWAITFARKKIMGERWNNFEKYFWMFLNENTDMNALRKLIINMVDDMNNTMESKTLEQVYFDFMFLFNFSGELKYRFSKIFGKSETIWDIISLPRSSDVKNIIILPQDNIEKYINNTEFRDKFISFLNKFYRKIEKSSDQDKKKMYFLSEILRIQSGEREWIGNAMNPMIQDMTMDDMFWPLYSRDINWLLNKIAFKWKQYSPGTAEQARKKIWKILEKIISDYMFPEKYRKS